MSFKIKDKTWVSSQTNSKKKKIKKRKTSKFFLWVHYYPDIKQDKETNWLMLLNCGVWEDSWESLGLKGDPTSTS